MSPQKIKVRILKNFHQNKIGETKEVLFSYYKTQLEPRHIANIVDEYDNVILENQSRNIEKKILILGNTHITNQQISLLEQEFHLVKGKIECISNYDDTKKI